jgi:hypothetical protein
MPAAFANSTNSITSKTLSPLSTFPITLEWNPSFRAISLCEMPAASRASLSTPCSKSNCLLDMEWRLCLPNSLALLVLVALR